MFRWSCGVGLVMVYAHMAASAVRQEKAGELVCVCVMEDLHEEQRSVYVL